MAGKNTTSFNGSVIQIDKTDYSRGYYLKMNNTKEAASVKLVLTDFNDKPIEYYDFDWFTTEDERWNVTSVRGVKTLTITHTNLNVDQEIYLLEELWFMDKYILAFSSSIVVLVLVLYIYKIKNAEWLCFEKKDDDNTAEEENGNSGKCFEKTKIYLWEIYFVALHNFNIYSDFAYFFTVPIAGTLIIFVMIISIIIPIFMIANISSSLHISFAKKIQMFFAMFTGTSYLFGLSGFQCIGIKVDSAEENRAFTAIMFIWGDGIQFYIQLVNSLFIGQSWTWIQVYSFISTLVALSGKTIIKSDKLKSGSKFFAASTLIVIILPVFIFTCLVFQWSEYRPAWAMIVSSIRFGYKKSNNPIY